MIQENSAKKKLKNTNNTAQIPLKNGLILSGISTIIFLITYSIFKDDFYPPSIFLISFVYPVLYCAFAVLSTYQITKNLKEVSMRTAFSAAMKTFLLGGLIYSIFLGVFFNYIDDKLAFQFNDYWHKFYLANKDLIIEKEGEELYQTMIDTILSVNLFSVTRLLQYFVFVFSPAYGILSILIGLFFRRKKAI